MVKPSEHLLGGSLLKFPQLWSRNSSETTEHEFGSCRNDQAASHHHRHAPRQLEMPEDNASLPSERSMRSVFDGLISPFMSCVQQPVSACVTNTSTTSSWDYDLASRMPHPSDVSIDTPV